MSCDPKTAVPPWVRPEIPLHSMLWALLHEEAQGQVEQAKAKLRQARQAQKKLKRDEERDPHMNRGQLKGAIDVLYSAGVI